MKKPVEKVRTNDVIIISLPSVARRPKLKSLPNFSTAYLSKLAVAN